MSRSIKSLQKSRLNLEKCFIFEFFNAQYNFFIPNKCKTEKNE